MKDSKSRNPPTQREKLTIGQRIKKNIFVGTKEDVRDSFIDDILFPSIRDFFVDSLYNMVDVMVFGRDERGYRGRGRRRGGYDRPVSRGDRTPTDYAREGQAARQNGRTKTSSRYIFENITFYDYTDDKGVFHKAIEMAEDVREAMYRMMETNNPHQVSVYEFYDECGQSGEWIDQEWIWPERFGPNNDIGIRFVGDGVQLVLPEPVYKGSLSTR